MPVPGANKGARTQNTMSEYLTSLLQDVAYMQALPDADLEFLTNVQQMLVSKLREPIEMAMQASMGGGPPGLGSADPSMGGGMMPGMDPMGGGGGMDPMAAMMGQMGGGMPPPSPDMQGASQLPPGLRNGIQMPPVDELRRLVGGM
jgi:hypothetical protein